MADPLDAITRWERSFDRVSPEEQERRDALAFGAHLTFRNVAKLVGVAYRCTRFLARARGLLMVEGLLCDVNDVEWVRPQAPTPPIASRDSAVMALHFLLKRTGPVALDLPAEETQEREDFVEAMSAAGRALRIDENDETRPAFKQLTRPERIGELWPPKEEILRFEVALVESVWNYEVDLGGRDTVEALREKLFVDPREAREFIRMARTNSYNQAGQINLEEERTVLMARLERLYGQSLAALDMKTARNAIKDMANILGLTRAAPDDLIMEVTRTLLAVSNKPVEQIATTEILQIPEQFRKPQS